MSISSVLRILLFTTAFSFFADFALTVIKDIFWYLHNRIMFLLWKNKIRTPGVFKRAKRFLTFLLLFLKITKLFKYYNSVILLTLSSVSRLIAETLTGIVFIALASIARFIRKPVDIGLGPEPLINNVYHKRALVKLGYTVETFVSQVYFITTEFDIRGDRIFLGVKKFEPFLNQVFGIDRFFLSNIYLFIRIIFKYKILYIYFNGGPLFSTRYLSNWEPFLYKLARTKVVVMPYGGDIHELSRADNLLFKHTMSVNYPDFAKQRRDTVMKQIDRWTRNADMVLSGCDWVDYMYEWDKLMLGHFSIDTREWKPATNGKKNKKLVVFHAPNHRAIKGTEYFIKAVEELKEEGLPVELNIVERAPNSKIREHMRKADIIADQLVIGWYAMFALEGMSLKKPVLCYISEEYEKLYIFAGLIKKDELPLVNCNFLNVKEKLRELVKDRKLREQIGKKSRRFVEEHHSLDKIGNIFDGINKKLGVTVKL